MPTKAKLVIVTVMVIVGGLVVAQLVGGSYDDRPGDPAVYSRIEGLTDCSALRSEFNAADARRGAQLRNHRTEQADVEVAYMNAADARMRTIGCYR